jgi:hypothetical protein
MPANIPGFAPGRGLKLGSPVKNLRFIACVLALVVWAVTLTAPGAQAATAAVSLSPSSGPAGTSVTVTGTGFPKKSPGTVTGGTSTVAFTASASGYFEVEVVIPVTSDPVVVIQANSGKTTVSAGFTVTYSSPSTTEDTEENTDPAPVSAAPLPSTAALRFGAGTPGGPLASAELDEVATLAGEAPSIILSYKDFNQAPPLTELDAVRARGAVTLLTWEPWAWGGGHGPARLRP